MNGPDKNEIEFEIIASALRKAGAVAVSAIRADKVNDGDRISFEKWIGEGKNAEMGYMNNWPGLRFDPREMHPGTEWIVCCAFSYGPLPPEAAGIASYALGDDYHKVIPKRIREALRGLKNGFGETARICVDSAPVRERYWAVRSGLGKRCESGLVSVEGYGTRVFLAEIMTPWEITGIPEPAKGEGCDHCGACRRACPGGAIRKDGTVDARRCVSYLTIEHKGEWSAEQKEIMNRPGAEGRLFGCEICQSVCHLNRNIPTTEIPEFKPRPELIKLNRENVRSLTSEDFSRIMRNSPIKRTGLDNILRNANH